MHIGDGVFSLPWCVGGYCAAAPLVGYSLYRTREDDIPRIATVGAAFFAASLIHFPVGISSVHLTLIGLTGILLGSRSILAILTGLLFQAVLFQHGGVTTLGLNTACMGAAALACGAGFDAVRRMFRNRPARNGVLAVSGGLVSGLGVLAAAVLIALCLYLADGQLRALAGVFTLGHAIIAVVEGVVGGMVIGQLLRIKPSLIIGDLNAD